MPELERDFWVELKISKQKFDTPCLSSFYGAKAISLFLNRDVYPVRGQTVLIRAPWVKETRGMRPEGCDPIYIIPRSSGDVSRNNRYIV